MGESTHSPVAGKTTRPHDSDALRGALCVQSRRGDADVWAAVVELGENRRQVQGAVALDLARR